MTIQYKEHLTHKGKDYYISDEPLCPYLESKRILFNAPNTACWRGYIGDWLIEDNKLYLVGLRAYISKRNLNNRFDSEEIVLDYLFPGQNKIFADWFSGVLNIPSGKELQYVHGYVPLYEKEFFMKIQKGVVVKEWENNFFQRLKKRFAYKFNSLLDEMEDKS